MISTYSYFRSKGKDIIKGKNTITCSEVVIRLWFDRNKPILVSFLLSMEIFDISNHVLILLSMSLKMYRSVSNSREKWGEWGCEC